MQERNTPSSSRQLRDPGFPFDINSKEIKRKRKLKKKKNQITNKPNIILYNGCVKYPCEYYYIQPRSVGHGCPRANRPRYQIVAILYTYNNYYYHHRHQKSILFIHRRVPEHTYMHKGIYIYILI